MLEELSISPIVNLVGDIIILQERHVPNGETSSMTKILSENWSSINGCVEEPCHRS